jgi:hypothetical protein
MKDRQNSLIKALILRIGIIAARTVTLLPKLYAVGGVRERQKVVRLLQADKEYPPVALH